MKAYHYFITLLFLLLFFSRCFYDVEPDISEAIKETEMPFTYELIKESRQKILTQEHPWESQSILFYNVMKNDSLWQMWYMGAGRELYNDAFGVFCYAYSYDGKYWVKKLPYSVNVNSETNILMSIKTTPIVEQYVFFDQKIAEYRMIGASINNGQVSTFIWKSKNGIGWYDKTLLYDAYYDTQFSVIIKNDRYYIYQRMMKGNQRAVARSIIDRELNIIEDPKLMLTSADINFPHVYNNAASKINDFIILFPTLYNEDTDSIKMTIGYEQNDKLYLSDANITEDIFFGENIKWGIISPGVIPTDEPNTFWIYYYGSTRSHNTVRTAEDNITKYYRIKIRIIPKPQQNK